MKNAIKVSGVIAFIVIIAFAFAACNNPASDPCEAGCTFPATWTTRTAATCTAAEVQFRVCADCGTEEVRSYGSPIAHSYGNWSITSAATCSTLAIETGTCSVCGDTTTRNEPEGELDPNNHPWVYPLYAIAATCIEAGYGLVTCEYDECGASRDLADGPAPYNHHEDCNPDVYFIIRPTGLSTNQLRASKGLCGELTEMALAAAVLTAIRTDVGDNNPVTIHFGDPSEVIGDETLNVADLSVNFTGDWGHITMTGRITGSNNTEGQGTIHINGPSATVSGADTNIGNTNTASSRTIFFNSAYPATLTVQSGTVSAWAGRAVHNNNSGSVIINGGILEVTGGGRAVHNEAGGPVTINNAEFDVTTQSLTIYNQGEGMITINNAAFTVTPTGFGGGRAVHNQGGGQIIINDGSFLIGSNNSRTVHNEGTGRITINNGEFTVMEQTAIIANRVVNNQSTGEIIIHNGTFTVPDTNTDANAFLIMNNHAEGKISIHGGTFRTPATRLTNALRQEAAITESGFFRVIGSSPMINGSPASQSVVEANRSGTGADGITWHATAP
jgi:hypothetical protein